ncbi:SIR2 family protein [Paenibacillus sp. FSL R10-2748]|uniref:SIR2 family protein n=1 Tax=Paenibacillus sp. FSL R10-2748 TaxID=2954658 RepID=UPI0030F5C38E
MRVTALLGAGASVDIGGPLSVDLTRSVRSKLQEIYDLKTGHVTKVPFLNDIAAELDNYFSPTISHFEDIFYTLESLSSYARGWQSKTVKKFKPHMGSFVDAKKQYFFDEFLLYIAKKDLLTVVGDSIDEYDSLFDPVLKHSWYSSFWSDAVSQCQWDIATLNYDHCIESSINQYEDGYEDIGQICKRFNPRKLLDNNTDSKILHLHGSILYGHYSTSDNRYMFEDQHEDLYLYPSYKDAKDTWFNRSFSVAQSHDETYVGPIVTGLRKTDKLLPYPYNTYYHQFQKSLIENDRLLIIGYSFGDYHLNSLLERVVRYHGQNRKIVIISYFPDPKSWIPDPYVMNWPGNEMLNFIAKAFKDPTPFYNTLQFQEMFESEDKRTRIYLGGVNHTFNKYGREIIDFLTK